MGNITTTQSYTGLDGKDLPNLTAPEVPMSDEDIQKKHIKSSLRDIAFMLGVVVVLITIFAATMLKFWR
jgi:hypothetical protein